MVLVNGFDAWLETPNGRFPLTSQHYTPDVACPDGAQRIESFTTEPWPSWSYKLEDGVRLVHELFVAHGKAITALTWRLTRPMPGVKLFVRPFLSGRDYHSLHKENTSLRFDASAAGDKLIWRPYDGVPAITALSNARYQHEPHWYCNFRYDEERARGLDFTEDLASPGVFEWDLSAGEAVWLLAASDSPGLEIQRDMSAVSFLNCLRENERLRRKEFPSRLHQAADAYIAQGRSGKTILAGYPWFTDWGRDTFIALRGFCLASGRLDDAREILLTWASAVSEGMLPNRFPDHGEQPEFNSVDASLWYVIAVDEFLTACKTARKGVSAREKELLRTAVEEILEGYAKGTRFGIRMDADGLLAAGMPGSQLTWMDAKIGDWVITPRTGKPVEVQALWLNALKVGSNFSPGWKTHFQRGLAAFKARFWNETSGYLYDVIDCNHEPGTMDPAFRPNQIFAVGGLPLNLLEQDQAERVVSAVEERLWTPLGLPSLAPGSPGYAPRYSGGVRERDSVYHQGTVWPWLIGPFIEAWVRGATVEAKHEARRKFLQPLLAHLNDGGVGHVSEIADADAPHTPRGCPFQAWSVGELLRADAIVLASEQRPLKAAPRSIFASARATRPAGAGRRKFESA